MACTLDQHPGWIVCRKFQQFPLSNVEVLPRLAEHGRVRPDDYLVNPALDICLQAKEIPELNAIFRKARLGPFHAIVRLLVHIT